MDFTTWIFAGVAFLLVLGLLFKVWGAFFPETFRMETTVETVAFLSEVTPLFFTGDGWMKWFPAEALPGEKLSAISFSANKNQLEFKTEHRTVCYDIISHEPGKFLAISLAANDPLRLKGMETGFSFTIFTTGRKSEIKIEEYWTVKETGYRLGFNLSLKKGITKRNEAMITGIWSALGNR